MRHENRKHESSMELWAEKEILIAIKREQDGYKKEAEKSGYKSDINEFSSIKSLYESAFKAYRLLLKNGPSGMSWAFMASVLRRLMDHQPLGFWRHIQIPMMDARKCIRMPVARLYSNMSGLTALLLTLMLTERCALMRMMGVVLVWV